jgi:probable HAF family extracellular repeat protein
MRMPIAPRKARLVLAFAAILILVVFRPVTAQTSRYKITDLGVLGTGATDYSRATAINNEGQVVGHSRTAQGNVHAFLRQDGRMIDLGTLPGADTSVAYAINDVGQVVGASGPSIDRYHFSGTAFLWTPTEPNGTQGVMIPLNLPGDQSYAHSINARGQIVGEFGSYDAYGDFLSQAFLWTPTRPNGSAGTVKILGTLPGGSVSEAYGINASGQVVGWSDTGRDDQAAFLWMPTRPNASSGSMTRIRPLTGGSDNVAVGINDSGQIVGSSSTPDGDHAFLSTPTRPVSALYILTDLGMLLGSVDSEARSINNAGQVTATTDYYDDNGDFIVSAFLWTPSRPNWTRGVLTALGATSSNTANEAFGLNAKGQVVGDTGYYSDEGYFFGSAFLWQPTISNGTVGTMDSLGTLPNEFSAAYGLSPDGAVVGSSSAIPDGPLIQPVTHAFLWRNGLLTDLGTVLDDNDSSAIAVNTAGMVIGTSGDLDSNGNISGRAFLWQNGALTNLGLTSAVAINAAGQILGNSFGDSLHAHAVLWQNGLTTDITPAGDNFSSAAAFNASGQVVGMSGLQDTEQVWIPPHYDRRSGKYIPGHYQTEITVVRQRNLLWGNSATTDLGALVASALNASGQVLGTLNGLPTLWQNGTTTDLNSLLPSGSGWTLTQANAINDAGQVVGTGTIPNNGQAVTHAFLLMPQNGVTSDLNSLIPSGSGWVLTQANAINNAGQIVGTGIVSVNGQGFTHAFLLTPQ